MPPSAPERRASASRPRGDGYHYLGNPQIKPETATRFEIGVKGADREHTLRQLAELMHKCIACHAAYTVLPPAAAP